MTERVETSRECCCFLIDCSVGVFPLNWAALTTAAPDDIRPTSAVGALSLTESLAGWMLDEASPILFVSTAMNLHQMKIATHQFRVKDVELLGTTQSRQSQSQVTVSYHECVIVVNRASNTRLTDFEF